MGATPTDRLEGADLWLGDAMAILSVINEDKIAIVTDPPYGIGYSTNHTVNGEGATWLNSQIANDADTVARDTVLLWAHDRKYPWAAFGSWKMPRPANVRGVLIWDKGPAFGMGDLSFPWKLSWEEIYIGGLGWSGHRDEGVLKGDLVHSHESRGRVHPNQKPTSLMRKIIKKLPADVVVIDPFMGSGSTGVAALREGRRFLGIECDPVHYATALARLTHATGTAVGSLFHGMEIESDGDS